MAVNFFESQDESRRNTTWLVFLFGLAVIAIAGTIYALAVWLTGFQGQDPRTGSPVFALDWWDPDLIGVVAVAVLLIVGGGSLYKIAQLRGGGRVIAEQLGGRLLHADTRDQQERRLLNIVEEMAIASGTPAPPVYLLEHEPGINAFAAGFTPSDAVIGVTRGSLEQLKRDELQGVIAHEFSHILNGDMRLNIRLIGVLHGILIIGIIGYFIFRSSMYGAAMRRSRDNNGVPMLLLGGGLMVIGFLGSFFGNWIKASVSRQREYLADASAVQFTRSADGLAGALKRIGGYEGGTHIESPNAPEASHMFFGQAFPLGLTSVFSTHPPLEERIRRLDPSFAAEARSVEGGRERPGMAGLTADAAASVPFDAAAAVAQIGRPTPGHLAYAHALIASLPEAVIDAAHEPFAARALVYALLIDRDPEARQEQLLHLAEHAEDGIEALTLELLPTVEGLDRTVRLPLADLTLAALRDLSPTQYAAFRDNVDALVRADQRIDLFEWALQRMLLAHLRPHFERVRPPREHISRIARLSQPCSVLFSALDHAGRQGDDGDDGASFASAAATLGLANLDRLPLEAAGLAELDVALDQLVQARPQLKQRILAACAEFIASDGHVTLAEGEVLRATADSLGCPMPPLLGSVVR